MKDILNVLKTCDLFKSFNTEEIEALLNCLKYEIRKYKRNDIVLLAGDKINYLGIVIDGELEISKDDVFGNSSILSKIGSSDMFAEAIVCSNTLSPVTVSSLYDSTIMLISYSNIINLCSSVCKFHVTLIYNLIKVIADKNMFLNFKIELLSARSIREKLNIYFSRQIAFEKSNSFKISFSRVELASFLNVNRSALSRELSAMQNEGLIKFNRNSFEIYY